MRHTEIVAAACPRTLFLAIGSIPQALTLREGSYEMRASDFPASDVKPDKGDFNGGNGGTFKLRSRRSLNQQPHPFLSPPHARTPRAPSPHASCLPSLLHRKSSITALKINSSTTARFEELGHAWEVIGPAFVGTSSCAVPRRGSPRLRAFLVPKPTLGEDARGLEGDHIMLMMGVRSLISSRAHCASSGKPSARPMPCGAVIHSTCLGYAHAITPGRRVIRAASDAATDARAARREQ
ncbi:hypothetical protein FB451DRAFT_1176867 [Mycena latifolia]|nr:hypothetical protein FB451DRAFT_1176867 [Mycena latifolia]